MTAHIQQWGAIWLKPMGKITLTKSVLSSLIVFQCVALMAPKGITAQIAKIIRKFMWEGGKTNTKKFHLINWKTICMDKSRGDLEIQEPSLMNSTLGSKLAWHLVSSNSN
jgi:hypothetical protein